MTREALFVDLIRNECAYVWMHSPGLRDEDAFAARNSRVLCEYVLEHARARSAGVLSLRHLGELKGVPQKDQIPR